MFIAPLVMAESCSMLQCGSMWVIAALLVASARASGNGNGYHLESPAITSELPDLIEFSNSTGTRIECKTSGYPKPTVIWLFSDGIPVSDVPGLRHIQSDRTLVFSAFRAEDYRQDVHAVVYRCSASNIIGTVVSKDIKLKAVVSQNFDVYVYDTYVIKGNTAVLKCHVPGFLGDYIKVTSWVRDDSLVIDTTDASEDQKYVMSPTGDLYIRDTRNEDALSSYRCKTQHRLTNVTRSSAKGGHLFVTEPQASVPPRVADSKSELVVKEQQTTVIPCVVQGYPIPKVEWFKKRVNGEIKQIPLDTRRQKTRDSLIILETTKSDAGDYICVTSNSVGEERLETRLKVIESLKTSVNPLKIIADAGKSVTFVCDVSGHPLASIDWLHNGKPIEKRDFEVSGQRLIISPVKSSHKGIYQCLAKNELESSLAAAWLQLGDSSPEILVGFDELTLNPGSSFVLKCVAGGSPAPEVRWTIDNILIVENVYNSFQDGNIISLLNKTDVNSGDGGIYSCIAKNKVGSSEYSKRINIFGSLSSRDIISITAIAGRKMILKCPVFGYPIDSVIWKKDGEILPVILRQTLFKNQTLQIEDIHRIYDSGEYLCFANNAKGESATGIVDMRVIVPPKITPFSFQDDLVREGMRARIQCVVSEGDNPLNLQWAKDGHLITSEQGVVIRDLDEYSSILTISSVTPKHNGNYTCIATNSAAKVTHTAVLSVNVPPKIIPFDFQDDQFFKGMRAQIICAISQGDLPIHFKWLKDDQRIPSTMGVLTRDYDGQANSLSIESVTSAHTGNYTCIAKNEAATVSHTAQLLVYVAPKINPFSFQEDSAFVGAFARVSCLVYQGDLPITLQWLKDNQSLQQDLGISVRVIDEYSSILTIERVELKHSGNYTCIASNKAATVSHTAVLTVTVPPKIVPFTFIDENIFEGMLVRVSCVVSRGDLPLTISWLKDGHKISSEMAISIRDFDDYSSVLSIDPATAQHNGNYTCVASNHAGTVTHSASLTVNVPPTWTLEPQNTIGIKGKSAMINCQANGFPNPQLLWMKSAGNRRDDVRKPIISDNSFRIFENGTLLIREIKSSDEGYFYCHANNGIGMGLSKGVYLTVQSPVYFETKEAKTMAGAQESVILRCEAKGDPPITFIWLHHNIAIDSYENPRYEYRLYNNSERGTIINELTIAEIDREDAGVYICVASNSHGNASFKVELIVQESPLVPEITTLINLGNRSVQLAWNVPHDGNSPLTKYILQYKRKQDSWQSRAVPLEFDASIANTVINGLQPATVYEFRIAAENDIGVGEYSSVVTLVTGEEAPEGAPQEVEVESTDPQSLRVSWKPPKKSLWNGIIRGYYIGYRIHGSVAPYKFATLEVPEDYKDDLIFQLSDLKMFTQYSIIVQAYNNGGKGPSSEALIIMTSEDVPSQPPQQLRCSSLSSRSIYVIWEPPLPHTTNGILRGYKVLYRPVAERYVGAQRTNVTQLPKITLNALDVDSNYSIQVLAFTKMGDGVRTEPIFCKTYEDVPSPPDDVRVLPATSNSVLVTWKPPKKPNGVITKYNVYYKPLTGEEYNRDTNNEDNLQGVNVETMDSELNFYEIKGLQSDSRYAFWVTATSGIGEGPSSLALIQSPASKFVPAKAASFNDEILSSWRKDITLACQAVGIPPPQKRWFFGDRPLEENDQTVIRYDGSLVLRRVDSEDSGNYTCKISNQHGKDEVRYSVRVLVPPSSPVIDVLSKSLNSVRLRWKAGNDGGDPIQSYNLYYKKEMGFWEKKELPADIETFTLENLACGATYQLYMEATNNIGVGPPCDIHTITTNGDAFSMPSKEALIREGSTYAAISLDAWPSNGCPVTHFVAEYKQQNSKEWTLTSNHIKPSQKKLIIPNLKPSTWYVLRMTAHTNGEDFNIAEYMFSTLSPSGGTISPEITKKEEKVVMFYLDPKIFIPIVAIIIVTIIASVIVFIAYKKNGHRRKKGEGPVDWTRSGTLGRYNKELGESVESFIHLQKMGAETLARHTTLRRGQNDPHPYSTIRLPYNEMTLVRGRRSDPLPSAHQVVKQQQMIWIPAQNVVPDNINPNIYGHTGQRAEIIPLENQCQSNQMQTSAPQPVAVHQAIPKHEASSNSSVRRETQETSFTNPVEAVPSTSKAKAEGDESQEAGTRCDRQDSELGDEAWLLAKQNLGK